MEKEGLSIIVPVYNEKAGLSRFLTSLVSFTKKDFRNSEIIVVDDGSNDGSADILADFESVITLKHKKNLGYGKALKNGVEKAKFNKILIIDADGTYPIDKIKELFDLSNEYDMVVGSRKGAVVHHSIVVRAAKWPINQLANYLVDFKIPDLNSGLRIFKKDVCLKYFNILPDGFSFTTNITLAHLSDGYSVYYMPINYHKRVGHSKVNPIKDAINFFILVVRMILLYNPLKFFIPLSLLLFLGSLISLYRDLFLVSNLSDKSVILFLSFIQVLSIGFVADLINKRSR